MFQTRGQMWRFKFLVVLVVLPGVLIGCSGDSNLTSPGTDGALEKDTAPYPVEALEVLNDKTLYGTVHISWDKPLRNSLGAEVEEYHVVVDPTGGEINHSNWKQMVVLDIIEADGSDSYSATFDNTHSGIIPGTRESFAVRPFYELDMWGQVGTVVALTPSLPNYQWGYVKDEMGNPMANVTVRMVTPTGITDPRGFASEQITGPDGMFDPIGPVAQNLPMVLVTDSPDTESSPGALDAYFDYRTEPLRFEHFPDGYRFALITRYELDPDTYGSTPRNFVEWLQTVSRSNHWNYDYTLRKFESNLFPLKVIMEDGQSDSGDDMAVAMRQAMQYWNDTMGEAIFVETDDIDEAQIRIEFPYQIGGQYGPWGQTSLIYPVGTNFGFTVPEIIKIKVAGRIFLTDLLVFTCRHELGHTLGFYGHDEYGLMDSPYVLDGLMTLTVDELRAFKAFRGLPNSLVMSGYEGSIPDYPTY